MTAEVLARKLAGLERYLEDLRPHCGKSVEEVERDPYEIERLLELVVQVAVDIVSHDLAQRGTAPVSYRDAFLRSADAGILPEALAKRLADAAGLRNILVHMYETIDYEIVAASLSPALEDFGAFLDRYRRLLATWEEPGEEG